MKIRIEEDKWTADILLTPAPQMLKSQQSEMAMLHLTTPRSIGSPCTV